MDIAVFSDIHGNYIAFQSCLEVALKRKIETFLFLGDYVGEFPYPQRTIELLYSLQEKYTCFFIRGNKEDYWINRGKDGVEWKNGTSSTGALYYGYANLKEKDILFFQGLPIADEIKLADQEARWTSQEVRWTDQAAGWASQEVMIDELQPILACHGSPNKNNEKLFPNEEHTREIVEKCAPKYILCGHTHEQWAAEYDGKLVLNPGAVGVALHSGGKAQFAILHSDGQEWKHELVSVDYDREQVIKEIQESGLLEAAPCWSQVTIHLIQTGELSHGTVMKKAIEYCREETGERIWYDIPERYWERAVQAMIKENYKK